MTTTEEISAEFTDYEPVQDQPHDKKEKWFGRARRFVGKVAIAGVFLTPPLAITAGEVYADDALLIPRHIADLVLNDGAPPVPQDIQTEITALADSPTDRAFIDMSRQLMSLTTFGTRNREQKDAARQNESMRYSLEQAKKYGLHLSDPRPFQERLKNTKSPQEIMEVLHVYGLTLDLNITAHQKTDLRDIGLGVTPIDLSHANVDKLKEQVNKMIEIVSNIPKELFDYAKISDLRVVDSLGKVDNPLYKNTAPGGEANPVNGIIYLPESQIDNVGLVCHEIAHRIDYRMNGDSLVGAWRDKEYNKLNRQVITSKDSKNGVANPYGATNPLEDKATMMEGMLNGLLPDLLDSSDPVVKQKYRMLLERLEEHIPGMGRYLLATSPHQVKGFD